MTRPPRSTASRCVARGSAASPSLRPIGNQATLIGIVWVAANARVQLAKGRPITYHGLAALSGVSITVAMTTVNTAKPRATQREMMLAAPAIAWLRSRNVPGFPKP